MVFIYGGAYQGKLDYARENFNISESDIFFCTDDTTEADMSKKCLYGYHKLVLAQIRAGLDPLALLTNNINSFSGKIIICDDISAGVVPMGAETRLWREAVGRCATFISKNSSEVWRVFCGIGTKLK